MELDTEYERQRSFVIYFSLQTVTPARAWPGINQQSAVSSVSPTRMAATQVFGHLPLLSQAHYGTGLEIEQQLWKETLSINDVDIAAGSLISYVCTTYDTNFSYCF